MTDNKDLIVKIKNLRDNERLKFCEIGERLNISRQWASALYRTAPDLKVWSKWSMFVDVWKNQIEQGDSINKIADEFGTTASVVKYHLDKEGVKSKAKKSRWKK